MALHRLIAVAILTFLAVAPAAGQPVGKPPINNVAGPTTSEQLRGIMTDETGTGLLVFSTDADVSLRATSETYTAPAITAGVLTVDLALGTAFNVSRNADITSIVISNPASGKASAFTLFFTANGTGYTTAWPASVKWANGVAPVFTTTNTKVDIISFVTNDGGNTWYGFIGGQNY